MLIPETEALWDYLNGQPGLRGFVLIGGSALALRLRHRLSEDLDFVWPGLHLPAGRLEQLCREAAAAGFDFTRNDDPSALDEFEIAGMDLHRSQQDFMVNGRVKVTFFCASASLARVIRSDPGAPCRVAELQELFDAKALVSASRSKSRDWLDLFHLLRDHGFTLEDYAAAFARAGAEAQCQIGLDRLTSGKPQGNDEGYETLADSPPSLDEMVSFFRRQRDEFEIRLAAEARAGRPEKN